MSNAKNANDSGNGMNGAGDVGAIQRNDVEHADQTNQKQEPASGFANSSHHESCIDRENQSKGVNGLAAFLLCLVLPLVMLFVIWLVSPNYRFSISEQESSTELAAPLGGDFLQEYVGGKIWNSHQRHRLYDLEWSKKIQHDPEVVGFRLEKKSYFPMVYPPFHYAMVSPLTRLSYRRATMVWGLCSALCLSVSVYLICLYYRPVKNGSAGLLAVGLIFVPILLCLNMGQKSTILLAVLTVTYLLLHHRKPFLAGIVFGLVAFKPHLGLVIGLVMLWKRQWRFAIGAILTVGLFSGYSYLVAPELWSDYLDVVRGMGSYVQTSGYQLNESHSLWGVWELSIGRFAADLVKPMALASSLAVVAVLLLIFRGPLQTDSLKFTLQFSACLIAMVLLSPHFYTYDLTILFLPMMLTGLVSSNAKVGNSDSDSSDESIENLDSETSLWLRPINGLWVAVFLGAGIFASLAGSSRIQFSAILFATILGAILVVVQKLNSRNVKKTVRL